MSEYVRMPKADYVAACNAIRTKTGKTDLIKSGEMEAEILGITTGGGASEDVRYVTFMSYDGLTEYGKKAVAVGDDCADPIARGVFDTPTRESDAQYNYTFYGWATEVNGGADSSALKNVTEDRVVYANFASTIRYYTISYYDGETLLHSESLAYGATPSYTTEKEGYNFEGWEPALATVTGDASYYAQFSENITFAGASWADIARVSEAGEAEKYFAIGDTKTFEYMGDTLTIAIAGFNHDDLADGSGKAGISCVCMNVPNKTTTYCQYSYDYYDSLEYKGMQIRTLLQGTMFDNLPSELQGVIKSVNKEVAALGADYADVAVETISDKLWLLSLTEMGMDATRNSVIGSSYGGINLGAKYDLFPTVTGGQISGVMKVGSTTTKANYWTRHQGGHKSYAFSKYMSVYGADSKVYSATNSAHSSSAYYLRFGFCI